MNKNAPSVHRLRTKHPPARVVWKNCRPEQLILDLYTQETDVALLQRLVRELHRLLYSLFAAHAQEILVEALPHGFSNTRVAKVQPFYAQGGGQPLVVKFGDIHIIQQEHENYREYVRDFIAGGSAVALDFQHTTHLGAIVYTFLGAAARQMQEFGAFYEHASPDQIKRLLDVLFLHTCGLWYASHTLQLLNWTEDYQGRASYTIKRLEQKTMERSLAVSWQGKLRFQSLQNTPDREFTNPFEALKAAEPIIRSTYMGITHGDLNPRNILVDRTEHPWLIDFQHTRYSHILRDVAMLDTVTRLQLVRSEQATLDERLTFEEAICNIKHFDQLEALRTSYTTRNPALAKAWETIIHLRTLARWMIGQNPFGEISEYSLALLYSTINSLGFDSLENIQCEHALLSASLLSDMLDLKRF